MKSLRGVLLALWAGLAGTAACAQHVACKDDPELPAHLALQAAAQVRSLQMRHGERTPAPRTQAVFARLVDALDPAQRAGHTWELVGYGSEVLNAHAMHTGQVLVSLGLDNPLLPEELVAAALAHEVAHVVLAHGIEQACFAQQFAQVSPPPPHDGDPIPEVWSSGLQPSRAVRVLMRTHELEADRKAVELLRRAGYPDHSMSRLLELLAGRSRAGARFVTSGSHPDPRLRIAKVREAELALLKDAGDTR